MKFEKALERWSILMLAVGLLLGLILGLSFAPKEKLIVREGTPDTPAALSSVHLMIDYGDGTVKTWNTVSHREAMSVVGLLETVGATKNIALLTTGGERPAVVSIDGITNAPEKGQRWQYWVNNTYEPRPDGAYYLNPGDIVLWKYIAEQTQ